MLPTPAQDSSVSRLHLSHAGTLTYTRKSLLILSFWLLWGDFSFSFFENIFGRFIPLFLRDLDAPNWLVGVMTGSLAGLVNIIFLPNISRWSDSYRSRWGRRIPFLVVVAPLAVFSLLCIGYAPAIARFLQPTIALVLPQKADETLITLSLLCVFVVAFHFFNMVLINAYNWLLRDVVPNNIMARFLSCFRIVGTTSSIIFLWYVFPHVLSHRVTVFNCVGGFYIFAFLLMCWNVKEGEYPPVNENDKRISVIQSFVTYFRECLSIALYRNYFIAYVLFVIASSCIGPFTTLFMRERLHMNMEEMGFIFAISSMASLLVFYPIGWMCDRFGSLLIMRGVLILHITVYLGAFFLVNNKTGYIIYSMLAALPAMAWSLSSFAASVSLFPQEKFGQFSSGLNVFGCGVLIGANFAIGALIDLFHNNYAIAFLWSAAFGAMALIALVFVFKEWRQHGGKDHYIAPLPQ